MVCTFFGQRDASETVAVVLREVLQKLVEEKGVDRFYVGQQGNFDRMAAQELLRLQEKYPHIVWEVVLAYPPFAAQGISYPTLYPAGLETVPPRFAINKRNEWMLRQADVVITCTGGGCGGAAAWKEKAIKKENM